MIEIKLANGATLKTTKGEEIYNFHRSNGQSIVPPQKKEQKQK